MILGFVKDLFFSLKLEEALKRLGHQAVVVSGEEAFAARLRAARPQLIIMDLTMDGVDVEGVLKGIREGPETAAIPILAFTTHADWKRSEPLKAYCNQMVTKNMIAQQLPQLLERYVGK